MPDFSRAEANKDVGKLLPYLRIKKEKDMGDQQDSHAGIDDKATSTENRFSKYARDNPFENERSDYKALAPDMPDSYYECLLENLPKAQTERAVGMMRVACQKLHERDR